MADSRIRVLHFGMSPTIGGAESFIVGLAERMSQEHFKLEVATPHANYALRERLHVAIGEESVHVLAPLDSAVSYRNSIAALLADKCYRIVHVHRNSAANIIPVIVAAKTDRTTKIVVHSHSTSSGAGALGNALHVLNRPYLSRLTDRMLACSAAAGEWLFGKSFNEGGTIVPNGADTRSLRFDPATRMEVRDELGISDDVILVGCVARIAPEKNQSLLIRALAMAAPQCNVVLILVGDGPERGNIEELAMDLGISDRVLFLGTRGDVSRLLQAMDVFVLPSRFEGFPIALVEAQASGLPCLASDAITSFVNVSGLVHRLPVDDLASWADTLSHINATVADRDRYATMVRDAGFDINETVRQIQLIYEGLTRE